MVYKKEKKACVSGMEAGMEKYYTEAWRTRDLPDSLISGILFIIAGSSALLRTVLLPPSCGVSAFLQLWMCKGLDL